MLCSSRKNDLKHKIFLPGRNLAQERGQNGRKTAAGGSGMAGIMRLECPTRTYPDLSAAVQDDEGGRD